MIERNKITISFLPLDADLWDYVQRKRETCNVSEYIRGLIRQDMNNSPLQLDEAKIVERILQALHNSEFIVANDNKKVVEEIILSDTTKDTILNLF